MRKSLFPENLKLTLNDHFSTKAYWIDIDIFCFNFIRNFLQHWPLDCIITRTWGESVNLCSKKQNFRPADGQRPPPTLTTPMSTGKAATTYKQPDPIKKISPEIVGKLQLILCPLSIDDNCELNASWWWELSFSFKKILSKALQIKI